MSEKTDIKSMDLEELKTFFSDMGEKAFRAKQVYEWLHVRQDHHTQKRTGTDFKTGWNPQISVFTGRRKCH